MGNIVGPYELPVSKKKEEINQEGEQKLLFCKTPTENRELCVIHRVDSNHLIF